MLNAQIEQEMRDDFAEVREDIEAPDGLTERLLAQDYRFGGRSKLLISVIVCLIAVLALVATLVVLNTGNRQPVAASVLASEFNVFNRPATTSDALPPTWPLARLFLRHKGEPTAIRLLASNPGYGVVSVYAATYPNEICLLERDTSGGSAACGNTHDVESSHVDFGTVSGFSIEPYAIGLVANDVTSIQIDGATAPVLKNNFFLAPISGLNPPFNLTIHLSDGRPISKTVGRIRSPRCSSLSFQYSRAASASPPHLARFMKWIGSWVNPCPGYCEDRVTGVGPQTAHCFKGGRGDYAGLAVPKCRPVPAYGAVSGRLTNPTLLTSRANE